MHTARVLAQPWCTHNPHPFPFFFPMIPYHTFPVGMAFDFALVQMPNLTGAQAIRELRKLGCNTYILGMTGDPSGCPERTDFEASGANKVVDKSADGMDVLDQLLRAFALPSVRTADGQQQLLRR